MSQSLNVSKLNISLVMLRSTVSLAIVASLVLIGTADYADKPCAARAVENRSVLCVCNATYCDTVIRETPTSGLYYTYVSSEAGQRFAKASGHLKNYEDDNESGNKLELDPTITYQKIQGFGGAVTDAAAINWKNLADENLMQSLIESYCGDSGLQYNMLRVPIGSTDFSARYHTYNELPVNDTELSNFTLTYEDYDYKIPMIKACMEASSAEVKVLTSIWSPPMWMKSNNNYTGFSRLKKEHLPTFAKYNYKFIESYAQEGIKIWGMSMTNEPFVSSVGLGFINSLAWTLDYLSEYIVDHLGPMIRNSEFKDIKILANEDQRSGLCYLFTFLVALYPKTLQYLDGVAVHFYFDELVPASSVSKIMADYPDLFVIYTEASAGVTDPVKVDVGSWARAELYGKDIIENLNHDVIGWMDWNMALNMKGGPSWLDMAIDSPVLVNAEKGEFYKQPMFYAMGHFFKFLPRDSTRINVKATTSDNIQTTAFLTPMNTIVVVIYNGGASDTVSIRLGDQEAVLSIEAKSFTTFELLNE